MNREYGMPSADTINAVINNRRHDCGATLRELKALSVKYGKPIVIRSGLYVGLGKKSDYAEGI